MKKAIAILFVFLLCLTLGACQKKTADSPSQSAAEKIQKHFSEMQGYECTATLTRFSNKGENVYETKQYYKPTGEYRLELTGPEAVAGNYTVFDGKSICQYNPRIEGKFVKEVPESQQRNELFLGQFWKNHAATEDATIESDTLNGKECTVLSAVIPGEDEMLSCEKLWVDNETLKPMRLVMYDSTGKERYILDYTEFIDSPELDNALFVIGSAE